MQLNHNSHINTRFRSSFVYTARTVVSARKDPIMLNLSSTNSFKFTFIKHALICKNIIKYSFNYISHSCLVCDVRAVVSSSKCHMMWNRNYKNS